MLHTSNPSASSPMAAKRACWALAAAAAMATICSGPTLPLVRVEVWEEMMVDSSLLSSLRVPCLDERALSGPALSVLERGRRRYLEAAI